MAPIPLVNAVHSGRLRASETKHEFRLTLTIGPPEGTRRGQMMSTATFKNTVRLQFVRSLRAGSTILYRETRFLNRSHLLLPMST